jgi:ubiquinone biosynthesis protein
LILDRRRRHLERYLEIGHILASYGWQSLLSRLGLTNLFGIRKRPSGVPPGPVQVRQSLEELGPTFVKLGQVLSTRPDIIPPNYIAELEKLQDRVPPIPFAEIRRVIEEEFAAPLKDVFAYIDEESLAAASLGQTHLATLLDGRDVVVKVQRPDIRKIIENDLEIIAGVARFLDQHLEGLKVYGLTDLTEEFSITILQELDYTREGRNGDQLKENFKDIPYVKIAATIWDYTPRGCSQWRGSAGLKLRTWPSWKRRAITDA